MVDKKFPPVDAAQYREEAIATSAASLEVMLSPDIAAALRIDDVRRAIAAMEILKKSNVSDVRLKGHSQLLIADIYLKGFFTSSMFPGMDAGSSAMLDSLKPNLVAVLKIGASITGAVVAGSGPDLSLEFKALPLFRELRIEELTVAEDAELATPADFIARIINKFADNISGELSRAKFAAITVPSSPVKSLKTSINYTISLDDGNKVDMSLAGQTVSSPFFAKAFAFNINASDVSVLVDLALTGETVPTPLKPYPTPEFSDFDSAFDGQMGELVATNERPDATWVALSKSSLSHLLNSGFQQANLCVNAEAKVPRQEFSEKIEIPDENTVDCTPTRNCTPTRSCTLDHISCTPTRNCSFSNINCRQNRDCSGRHINCGGYEWYQAPDKLRCEAEKAAWKADCERIKITNKGLCEADKSAKKLDCERIKSANKVACEAKKSARKLDCERLKSQEKGQCEIEKTGEKAICETGKEALKRLSRTGNLANVEGFAQAAGRLQVCAPKVVFDSKLESAVMTLVIEGQADARVGVKWVPLDILGHATCPFQWTEHKDLRMNVPPQNVDIRSGVQYVGEEESLLIIAEVETSELKVELKPKPRDLILQNYNMRLACPLVGGLLVSNASVVVVASESVPELQGKFTFPGEKRKFEFEVEPIMFKVPSLTERGKAAVSSTESAILVDFQYAQ
ncbi:MAG: hypothetical protein AAF662_03920 [Pseudomonadota bacterium]